MRIPDKARDSTSYFSPHLPSAVFLLPNKSAKWPREAKAHPVPSHCCAASAQPWNVLLCCQQGQQSPEERTSLEYSCLSAAPLARGLQCRDHGLCFAWHAAALLGDVTAPSGAARSPPLAVLSSQPCSQNSHRQRCLAGGRQPGSLVPAVTGCLCPWRAGSTSTSAAGTDVRVRKGTVFSNLGGTWEQWSIQLTQPDLEELIPFWEHSHGCSVAVGKGWRAWGFAQTVHQKTQESPPDLNKATSTLNLYQPAVNCFWKHQEVSFRISLCITNLRKL